METRNSERIDLRLPTDVKERVRQAAAMSGRSMSDFIVAAALEKADDTVAAVERWELGEADSRFALSLLTEHHEIPGLRQYLALTAEPQHT